MSCGVARLYVLLVALLQGALVIINIVILGLSYSSLVIAAITPPMAALTVTNWLALLVVASSEVFKLCRGCYGGWTPDIERRIQICVFAVIMLGMLPSAVYFATSTASGMLCTRFADLPNACVLSRTILVLSWLGPAIALVGLVWTLRVHAVPLVEKSMDSDYLGSATPMWCPTTPMPLPPTAAIAHQPSEHSAISITHSMEMGFFNMPYHESIIPTAWNPFAGPRSSRIPLDSTPVTPVSSNGARASRLVEGV
ncbi:hypothetical protein CYLTODRAFT_422302 [Cylindrobasidium torrendii FP15055 ss-10]|uniref:Uncharacterized protein n=1 Tax=Cylindrobasidium torrendii FP15055 ss-10 TaxID=1314674 RepID=A0A0D7BB27_9AGAR|nr:hypothetical protein CYLTODRAFT_422302 [Cylindrobasidium torrendii FP15055 ss-10]